MTPHGSDIDRTEQWADWKARFLRPRGERPASSARGLHHFALLSSDVERTITFYQDLLEFPLVNCSRTGTTGVRHTSSSISAMATTWPTSISPGSSSATTKRCSAASTTSPSRHPEQWDRLVAKLRDAGIEPHIVNGIRLLPRADGERWNCSRTRSVTCTDNRRLIERSAMLSSRFQTPRWSHQVRQCSSPRPDHTPRE